jgi:Methanogen output domain 1
LAGTLQDVVGLEEASGFVQVGEVLVDLKRRIQGVFYILEQTDEKIVFRNRACPIAEKVLDRPALCMMTSNVFGSIAAGNLGFAKVVLKETIARALRNVE